MKSEFFNSDTVDVLDQIYSLGEVSYALQDIESIPLLHLLDSACCRHPKVSQHPNVPSGRGHTVASENYCSVAVINLGLSKVGKSSTESREILSVCLEWTRLRQSDILKHQTCLGISFVAINFCFPIFCERKRSVFFFFRMQGEKVCFLLRFLPYVKAREDARGLC